MSSGCGESVELWVISWNKMKNSAIITKEIHLEKIQSPEINHKNA